VGSRVWGVDGVTLGLVLFSLSCLIWNFWLLIANQNIAGKAKT